MKNIDREKILFYAFLILAGVCLGLGIYFCMKHLNETGFVVSSIVLLVLCGIFLYLAGIFRPRRKK